MPLRCLQIEMVVVRHQAVAMYPKPEGGMQKFQEVEELGVVALIREDDALLDAPIHDVVERARISNA